MGRVLEAIETAHTPETLVEQLRAVPGVVLLRSALFEARQARFSFVAAWPFLWFRSAGSRCEIGSETHGQVQFGNPWQVLGRLMERYELLDEPDLPFPLGGCFGYWGYELKGFLEPRLARAGLNDLDLPDCQVGFYDSLVVFDHLLGKTWLISTGMRMDGSRDASLARHRAEAWRAALGAPPPACAHELPPRAHATPITSTVSCAEFLAKVQRAQRYIRAGDIYQVNLSHRLAASTPLSGWGFYQALAEVSPAPFAAYLDCGGFQVVSASPELFLRLSGGHILTRPIKGTRPRSSDSTRDTQLSYELQTSPKEMAELVMITDLLRNDLGRVCEYGSVRTPELARLERYPQVQHLVSTVEGVLRPEVTHLAALAACFPGGSITGAPKIRAIEIIHELETVARGPYTGCLGYLGFNRESQLSMSIRTAIVRPPHAYFHVGAGIVADSVPEAEYQETLDKAGGFLAVARRFAPAVVRVPDALGVGAWEGVRS